MPGANPHIDLQLGDVELVDGAGAPLSRLAVPHDVAADLKVVVLELLLAVSEFYRRTRH